MPRSKGDVRRRLQEAALALYRERGYDNTTTAEIAARAGVTERTFFRYFPDKREVLFDEAAFQGALNAAFDKAPRELGPLDVILWAFRSLEKLFEGNRSFTVPGHEVIARTPALRERQLAKAASTITVVTTALQRRGLAPDQARLAAATGMAAVSHALGAWFEDSSLSLKVQLERAFKSLRGLSGAAAPKKRKAKMR
jgi:AcrR family transcriptional regulator